MKKLIIICIIYTILCANLFAQQEVIVEKNTEKGIKLNFNAGFHLSNMIGKDVRKDDNLWITKIGHENYHGTLYSGGYTTFLPGYKFGFGVTFDKTKNFSWGLDLNLETKGCRIPIREIIFTVYSGNDISEERVEASDLYSKIRLYYIVIPIKTEFKYKKFYVMPGAYTGFLLSALNFTNFEHNDQHFNFRYNVSSHYAFIDVGVFLNTGFCVPLPKQEFIKIGVVGQWNVHGIESRNLDGGSYSFFGNQVLGLELKYEFKVK